LKKTTITLTILALLLLTSCLPAPEIPPYAVWVSEDSKIILYIKPEYSVLSAPPTFIGVYTLNDINTKVLVQFGTGRHFELFNLTEPRHIRGRGGGGEGVGINHSGLLLAGTYRLLRDEIHYNVSSDNIVIFRRIEDYEPICPEWIANFEPMPE